MMTAGPREVSGQVQQLLLPSYFPDPVEGATRVAALLKKSPAAGRAFCAALSRGMDVSLEQVMALAEAFKGVLMSSPLRLGADVKDKDRGVKRRGAPGRRRAEKDGDQEEVVEAIVEARTIPWAR